MEESARQRERVASAGREEQAHPREMPRQEERMEYLMKERAWGEA
jgi:hypothetical protein